MATLRDLAGNAAASFTDQPVIAPISVVGAGASTSSGTALLHLIARVSATAVSTSSGTANLLQRGRLGAVATGQSSGSARLRISSSLSSTATSISSGTARLTTDRPGGISAAAASISSGSAVLRQTHILHAVATSNSSGTAGLRQTFHLMSTAQSFSGGRAVLREPAPFPAVTTVLYIFEPPTVNDVPTVLPDTRGRARDLMKWYKPRARGRTVIKVNGAYETVDAASVPDLVNTADVVYLGGHIYTIDQDAAAELVAAGYTVELA